MRTLQGQNIRILKKVSGTDSYQVFAKAQSCSFNLTNNTQDGSNKDITGSAQRPIIVSRGWSVSLDSMDVLDMAALLTSIQNMEPLDIMFSPVSETDNQTPVVDAAISPCPLIGKAYLSDATFNFNDRESSAKQIQFTGASELSLTTIPEIVPVTPSAVYTQGQKIRLLLKRNSNFECVAAAKQLSFHVALNMEDATTKDTYGDFQLQEPVGLSYDITSSALVKSGEEIPSSAPAALNYNDVSGMALSGVSVSTFDWEIASMQGDNNRNVNAVIVSGKAIITNLTLNANNRQKADYTINLSGAGAYVVNPS